MFCNVGIEFQRIYADNSVKNQRRQQLACLLFRFVVYDHILIYLNKIIFQAVNRAGISSNYTFINFGVDRTPPTGGHVMDGLKSNVS